MDHDHMPDQESEATPHDLPEGWVILTIPNDIKLPPADIADCTGWALKKRPDGRWNACLRENYEHGESRMLDVKLVVAAQKATGPSAYEKLSLWKGQDAYVTEHMRVLGNERLKELSELATRVRRLGNVRSRKPNRR